MTNIKLHKIITSYSSKSIFLIVAISLLCGCTKDDLSPGEELAQKLIGKWINISVHIDGVESFSKCPYSKLDFRKGDEYWEYYYSFSEETQECIDIGGASREWGINPEDEIVLVPTAFITLEINIENDQLILLRKPRYSNGSDETYLMKYVRE